jgi:hypothetical protein
MHEDAPAADVHRASHDTHDDGDVAPVLVLEVFAAQAVHGLTPTVLQ